MTSRMRGWRDMEHLLCFLYMHGLAPRITSRHSLSQPVVQTTQIGRFTDTGKPGNMILGEQIGYGGLQCFL